MKSKMSNREMINKMEEQMYLEGLSDKTRERYTSILNKAIEHFKGREMSGISMKEMREYAVELRKKYKASTFNNHMAAIKYVEVKIIRNKEYNKYDLPNARIKRQEVVTPSGEEIIKLVRNTKDIEILSCILLAVGSGLRIEEIAKVKVTEINRAKETLKVKGKGGKERETVLSKEVIEVLGKYYKTKRERSESEYLFYRKNKEEHIKSDYIGREIKKIEEKIGMKEYTVHNMRKYFATEMYGRTKDIKGVSVLLGHKDLTTQEKYINNEIIIGQEKTPSIKEIIERGQV